MYKQHKKPGDKLVGFFFKNGLKLVNIGVESTTISKGSRRKEEERFDY